MKNKYPFCSLIVLNYNGEKIISNSLTSLINLNYPKGRYEILIVDNGSIDGSKEVLDKLVAEHNNIKVFYLNKNIGFSKGNNYGIKKAKGEYVALINNDCFVEKNWLKESVNTILEDEKIFAVNSKVLLYPKFINITFLVDPKLVPVYTWLSKSDLYRSLGEEPVYLLLSKKLPSRLVPFLRFNIEVPYDPYGDQVTEFKLLCNSRGFKFDKEIHQKNLIQFEGNFASVIETLRNGDDVEYSIRLKLTEAGVVKNSLDKIQNAGIIVFQDGYARDIGAVVSGGRQYYEYDLKQFNKTREVYAVCAAAALYRKNILKRIGLLDEAFFMYYEDVEICERARFAGFKSIYNPRAVVRHHHAFSSREWSSLFIYHVEKGRLLHVFYNFPFIIFLKEYFSLVFKSFVGILSIFFRLGTFLYNVRSKRTDEEEPKFVRRIQTIKALSYFLILSPILGIRLLRYAKRRRNKKVQENYLSILKGDWYSL